MLTPDQLAAIDRHLRKENWLLNEDLITELTDHYVAGIEDRLTKGMAFDLAIREIHRDFGGRKGLLKMEEDKISSHSRLINLELGKLLISYVQPPRLSLTILLLGFAYWSSTKSLVAEWLIWINGFFVLMTALPLLVLFFRNGYLYVAGKKQSMKSVRITFYRYILAINLLNILNFFWGNTILHLISHYSIAGQTFIAFVYLLIWTIILEFVLVQPYRHKVLAS